MWDYIIDPRNQPLWVPYIESVAGVDRPLQTGDLLIQWRRNFFRRKRQELLVEEVIPYRSFRLRILSAEGRPMDATATVTVEQAADPGATWVEEAIALSLGKGPLARWVQRWLPDSLSQSAMATRSQELAPKRRTLSGKPPHALVDGLMLWAGTQPMCMSECTSMPAAFGLRIVRDWAGAPDVCGVWDFRVYLPECLRWLIIATTL